MINRSRKRDAIQLWFGMAGISILVCGCIFGTSGPSQIESLGQRPWIKVADSLDVILEQAPRMIVFKEKMWIIVGPQNSASSW